LYHIKELTPYLDDITYIDNTRKPHPISLKMRGFAWYYVYNGNHKSDAHSRSAYGKLNKKTGKIEIDKEIIKKHNDKGQYTWGHKIAIEAGRLYNKPYIQESIRRIQEEFIKTIKLMVPQSIVEQLHIQATYDPSMFIDIDGSPCYKKLTDIPQKYRCCVEGIETKYYGRNADKKVVSIKLVDRDKARKHLLRMIPEHMLAPEKITLIHKTVDVNNKEIGFDISKLSDQEIIEKYKELEDMKNEASS
jgi:hypothetical protein